MNEEKNFSVFYDRRNNVFLIIDEIGNEVVRTGSNIEAADALCAEMSNDLSD